MCHVRSSAPASFKYLSGAVAESVQITYTNHFMKMCDKKRQMTYNGHSVVGELCTGLGNFPARTGHQGQVWGPVGPVLAPRWLTHLLPRYSFILPRWFIPINIMILLNLWTPHPGWAARKGLGAVHILCDSFWGLWETPPLVINCDKLARPPTPLKNSTYCWIIAKSKQKNSRNWFYPLNHHYTMNFV